MEKGIQHKIEMGVRRMGIEIEKMTRGSSKAAPNMEAEAPKIEVHGIVNVSHNWQEKNPRSQDGNSNKVTVMKKHADCHGWECDVQALSQKEMWVMEPCVDDIWKEVIEGDANDYDVESTNI